MALVLMYTGNNVRVPGTIAALLRTAVRTVGGGDHLGLEVAEAV